MKRLAALAVAVLLVVGSVLVRNAIDDDGSGGGAEGATLRLRCSTELAEVCEQLAEGREDIDVDVEDPGRTADSLAEMEGGGDPELDLWLTDAAWPAIVAENREYANRGGDPPLGEQSEVLARSPVVLATRRTRPARLEEACAGTVTWSCVGDAATGGVTVGLPSAERGDGLAVLASAVAGRLGATDYAVNDFDDPDFTRWFDAISAPDRGPALGDQTPLRAGVATTGRFAVVGALEADVARLPRSRDLYDAIYPEPVVTSDVVLVPARAYDLGEGIDRLGGIDRIREVLAGQGWRVDGGALPEGADGSVQLPEGQGMPGAGVLQALRERWED